MLSSESLISAIDLGETLKISHQQPLLITPDVYNKDHASGWFGFLSLGKLLGTLCAGHATLGSPDTRILYLGTQRMLQQTVQTSPAAGEGYAGCWPGNELREPDKQALLNLGFSQVNRFPVLGYRLAESGVTLCNDKQLAPVDGFPGITAVADPHGELTLEHMDTTSLDDLKTLWKVNEF